MLARSRTMGIRKCELRGNVELPHMIVRLACFVGLDTERLRLDIGPVASRPVVLQSAFLLFSRVYIYIMPSHHCPKHKRKRDNPSSKMNMASPTARSVLPGVEKT
jgi:hypothetical protein